MSTEAPKHVGSTRDAHGRVVKLLDPLPLFALRRHDVVDAEALDRIVEELEPGARGRRIIVLLALALIGVVMIGIAVSVVLEGRAAWGDLVGAVTDPALLLPIVGGVFVPWIAARKARLTRVRNVMLRHRRCPHCGYGLTGVPAHEDGATVCPECGCAWRIDDADDEEDDEEDGPEKPQRSRATLTLMVLLGLGLAAMAAAGLVFFMRY
jgi:hypothetical protein